MEKDKNKGFIIVRYWGGTEQGGPGFEFAI